MIRLADFSLIPRKWSVDLARLSILVVNLGLAVLLVYGLVQLVGDLRSDKEMGSSLPPAQTVGAKTSKLSTGQTSGFAIAQWHLFGKAEPVALQANKLTIAPDTKLNLTLRGIYFPDEGEGSIAIIQDSAKQEQHFVIGNSVFELATLEQIHIDRVILLHNGKHETLRLPKESLGLEFVDDARVVASKAIQAFRDDFLIGDMEKYIFHVDYDTAYDEDGFAGFIVVGDSDKGKEMLAKIGFKDGDIVKKINGIDLLRDPKMIDAMRDLKTAEFVDLTIERDGATVQLMLDFTQK